MIDVSVLWWPNPGRFAPVSEGPVLIRFRCVGSYYGGRFRIDRAEALDPIPPGLYPSENKQLAVAICQAVANRLGAPVMSLAVHRMGDISEWHRERQGQLEGLASRDASHLMAQRAGVRGEVG